MARQRILGVVLAGGAGRRLGPLTADRAKSAVPFGGIYRVVDFTLSNLVNGGVQRICVLTQYKSHSLNRHITTTWQLNSLLDNYVAPVPAQQWLGPRWQAGSADAIYQSLTLIERDRPGLVLVAGADHVYRMDPNQMIQAHLDWDAGVTVAAIPVPRTAATDFGVIRAAAGGHRIEAFQEKPADPPCLHGSPDEAFASMGTYVFDTAVLVEALRKDAADEGSGHSMGGDIIPRLVRDGAAHVYDFLQNKVPGADARDQGYWREVGTIDSYFEAHMDLCAVHPVFNLYNNRWPILTHVPAEPPAKFVHEDGDRAGRAFNSVISNGVIVSGGLVRESVLSAGGPGGQLGPGGTVGDPAQHPDRPARRSTRRHPGQERGRRRRAPSVGVDKEHDRARGFVVSAGGITVVGKGQVVARPNRWSGIPRGGAGRRSSSGSPRCPRR